MENPTIEINKDIFKQVISELNNTVNEDKMNDWIDFAIYESSKKEEIKS